MIFGFTITIFKVEDRAFPAAFDGVGDVSDVFGDFVDTFFLAEFAGDGAFSFVHFERPLRSDECAAESQTETIKAGGIGGWRDGSANPDGDAIGWQEVPQGNRITGG